MRALVAGDVIEASPDLRDGGVISKGDLLLRIDPFDYEVALDEAKAQIAETEARLKESEAEIRAQESTLSYAREQLEIAQSDLERAQNLVERGAVSQQTLDQRRLTKSQRKDAVDQGPDQSVRQKARVDQQRAALQRLRATKRTAERNLRDTRLESRRSTPMSSEPSAEVGKDIEHE